MLSSSSAEVVKKIYITMDWTCSCTEETGCAHRIFFEKTTKKVLILKAEKGSRCLAYISSGKRYEDTTRMENDQKCVLLRTLLPEFLKLSSLE
jgi:glucose dehydrogenase